MESIRNTYDDNQGYLEYLEKINSIDEIITDERLAQNDNLNMAKHNKIYTKLLKCYVENVSQTLKAKYWFKIVFFFTAMLAIVAVTAGFIGAIYYAFSCESVELAITSIAGAFISFITATITLPNIIAKYLFNFNEEKDALEIIKRMQEFDKIIRRID